MVVVQNIQNKTVKVYTPSDELLVETNSELIFNDIRLQIAEQNLEGYYIEFEDEKINILSNGKMERWPDGLFDISIIQLAKLISINGN